MGEEGPPCPLLLCGGSDKLCFATPPCSAAKYGLGSHIWTMTPEKMSHYMLECVFPEAGGDPAGMMHVIGPKTKKSLACRDATDQLGSGALLPAQPHALQDVHSVLVHPRLRVPVGQPRRLVHAGRRRRLQHLGLHLDHDAVHPAAGLLGPHRPRRLQTRLVHVGCHRPAHHHRLLDLPHSHPCCLVHDLPCTAEDRPLPDLRSGLLVSRPLPSWSPSSRTLTTVALGRPSLRPQRLPYLHPQSRLYQSAVQLPRLQLGLHLHRLLELHRGQRRL